MTFEKKMLFLGLTLLGRTKSYGAITREILVQGSIYPPKSCRIRVRWPIHSLVLGDVPCILQGIIGVDA
jgi:hypothetical protein